MLNHQNAVNTAHRKKLSDLGVLVLSRWRHDDVAIFSDEAIFERFGCQGCDESRWCDNGHMLNCAGSPL